MNYFGKIISNISQAYSEINPATLTGAIDVIIVEQQDGSYNCSPFHVRFGKMGVIRSKEKIVDIEINGQPVDIHMKLGDSGEAYFLEECDDEDEEESSPNVQSLSNTKANDATNSDKPPTCDSNDNVDDKSKCDNETQSSESNTHDSPKSDSVVSANASVSDKGSNPKRFRRKKKKGSRQHNQADTSKAADQPESSAECERESADDILVPRERNHENEANHQYAEGELHPFSDSEVNNINHNQKYKKQDSIDPYDCKSDSEYEMFKANSNSDKHHDHDNISWGWGELPNVKEPSSAKKDMDMKSANNNKSPRTSVLGALGSIFTKDTKDANINEDDKGIYLDEVDPENPEVAAKYFPNTFTTNRSSFSHPKSNASDDDIESGNGPSLSNSPHSVEFNYPPPDFSNEFDEKSITSVDLSTISKVYHDMSMSLCGGIENLFENPSDSEHFLQSIISFDDFSENPLQILSNPNLVIRMGGRYYTWKMASSIILSLLMFQRPLPEKTLQVLKDQCIPKKNAPQNTTSSWRSWFRSNPSQSESNQTNEDGTIRVDGSSHNGLDNRSINSSSSEENAKQTITASKSPVEYTSDEDTMDIVLSSNKSFANDDSSNACAKKNKYRKVLRLQTDVIKSLNLKRNCNDVMFSVTTAFQGTSICKSKIFFWRYDDKIVISDIDGTITKSDVLGHILPYIGKDWAQIGVTQLYSNIESNGYKFLYLSARAIGQAKVTRDYLRALRQEDIGLPDGPLLLSPTSLFSALHREVIEKKPEEFKISCLKDIQTLFPGNPFFAGFGNKINDNWAYKAVGIDSSRIFTINPKGELKLEKIMSFKSSYTDLSQFVDQMFPPLQQHAYYDGFSSFLFWRPDIPELDDKEFNAKD